MKKTCLKANVLAKTIFLSALFAVVSLSAHGQTEDGAESWHKNTEIEPVTVGDTPNTAVFGKHVYFAGQPGADDFEKYAALGVTTVLNLRTAAEIEGLDFDESAAAKKAGMEYTNVPIGREDLSKDTIERILKILDTAGEGAVLLHCASSNRVGCIWSVYRAIRHGLPIEEAIAEGKQAGMRAPALEERARKYVKDHSAGSN